MANNNIDTLRIDVQATNSATKTLGKVVSSLKSLSQAIDKIDTTKLNNFTSSLQTLGSSTNSAVERLKSLSSTLKDINQNAGIKGLTNNINKLSNSLNKLGGNTKATKTLENVKKELNGEVVTDNSTDSSKQVGAFDYLVERLNQIKTNISSALAPIKATITNTINTIKPYIATALNSIKNTVNKFLTLIKNNVSNIINGIKDGISRTFNVIKTVVGGIASAIGKVGKGVLSTTGKMFSSSLKGVTNLTKGFSKLASTFGRVLTYKAISAVFQAINKAISQGITNLYQYSKLMSGTFSKSMDQLATSCQYFSNSVAAAIAPLINAVAPVVDAIIDKLVQAINVINQFFAALTGAKTWTKAKKQATEYASAVGSGSKAVDKLKGSLAGFDEINNIGNSSDSSSSGSSTDYGGMFEEQGSILSDISDFANQLREAFESGDWATLGALVAGKVNDVFDTIDWKAIGSKMGYAINGVIATVSSFIDNTDWYNISASLSTLFNSAIEQIDFSNLGSIFMSKWTIIGDMIIGAIETIDWELVGKSIKDFFIGAFDKGSSFIDKYDWGKIGSDLWTKLKELINGLDFGAIARSFFTLFGKALGAAVSVVASFFKGVVDDMLGYFSKYTTNEDGTKKTGIEWIEGVLQGIIDGLKNIGQWILDNVFTPIIDGFKSAFKINSPSKVMEEIGGYLVDGFMEGFNLFGQVGDKVAEWSGKVVEWFTKGEDGKGIVEHFQEIGGNIISKFKEKISTKYTDTKNSITTWAGKVKSWFTSDGKVNNTEWQTYASNVISGFKSKITNTYTTTKSSITTWANNVNTWFKDKANRSSFYECARDVINGFGSGIGDLYNTTKSKIQDWASSVSGWFKSKLSIHSPSKVFYGFGENVIQGFNNSIKELGYTSENVMSDWTKEIASQTPSVSLAMDTSSLGNYDVSSLSSRIGVTSDGSLVVDGDNETNSLLEQLINQVANIDLNPYITVKDVGKASVKYINSQSRIKGTSLI